MPMRIALALLLLLAAGAASAQTHRGRLTGAAENPPNNSSGAGSATVVYDAGAQTLSITSNFSGLTGNTTAAHIHCCTDAPANVGVATRTPSFAGFPLGVTSGAQSEVLDLTRASSFNASYITANGGTPASAAAALTAGLAAGRAYFNIHTNVFPGGEIRGFLAAEKIFASGFEG